MITPRFPGSSWTWKLGSSSSRTAFPLEKAQDADVGSNSISSYRLSSNEHFASDVKKRSDGSLVPELLLEKTLDSQEKQSDYRSCADCCGWREPPKIWHGRAVGVSAGRE